MQPQEVGATEWLANLSTGTIVLAAIALTIVRFALVPLKHAVARSVAELCESLTLAGVLVFLVIRPFLMQAFFIPSPSMEPTLMGHSADGENYRDSIHDHLFVNKLSYRIGRPEHGDIIVFRAPKDADWEHNRSFENVLIKRLIGLPGDTIEVKPDDGGQLRVWRNARPLTEGYIAEPMVRVDGHVASEGSPRVLGPNEYFVMGDNRNKSNDSRFWGIVTRDRIIGKASFIFWPVNRLGLIR